MFTDESVPQPLQEECNSDSSSENTIEAKYETENIRYGQISCNGPLKGYKNVLEVWLVRLDLTPYVHFNIWLNIKQRLSLKRPF